MTTLKQRIIELLQTTPGLTDREITDLLFDKSTGQQPVNQAARALSESSLIFRQKRTDGKIGNYLNGASRPEVPQPVIIQNDSTLLSEDAVKLKLQKWLESSGWQVKVIWGREHGIDVEAWKDEIHWIIEVKGSGSLNAMRVNYFLAMLGELLQRMNEPDARYSIALPDMQQFRRLWQKLPPLAKSRTTITALFVDASGQVEEVH